jgi:hypothetical protein
MSRELMWRQANLKLTIETWERLHEYRERLGYATWDQVITQLLDSVKTVAVR